MRLYVRSAAAFDEAMALAMSPLGELPEEWIERTRRIGRSTNKTFIAALGTALLARAVDGDLDPLSLKSSARPAEGLRAYSARGLATNVLVPKSVEHRVDLGVHGREPLNNSPFFREERVSSDLHVRAAVRPELEYLVECLERAAQLSIDEALHAFAAFLAVRRRPAEPLTASLPIFGGQLSIHQLAQASSHLLRDRAEGGRRAQALLAAALDLVFEGVEVGRVNDPSARAPGDVRVRSGRSIALAAEARQKDVHVADVLLWVGALEQAQVGLGIIAALSPTQPALDERELERSALSEHGVALEVVASVPDLLRLSAVWSGRLLRDVIAAFPDRLMSRMRELSVSEEGQALWRDLLERTIDAPQIL